jgi:hypothetical protein
MTPGRAAQNTAVTAPECASQNTAAGVSQFAGTEAFASVADWNVGGWSRGRPSCVLSGPAFRSVRVSTGVHGTAVLRGPLISVECRSMADYRCCRRTRLRRSRRRNAALVL